MNLTFYQIALNVKRIIVCTFYLHPKRLQNFMGKHISKTQINIQECWMRLWNVYLYSSKEILIRTE